MNHRTNEQWLDELRLVPPQNNKALEDLRNILVRGLRFAFTGDNKPDESLIEDFAQDSIIKILEKLDTFQGKSKFTTWANTIAVRTALAEMRRKRWQDSSLDEIVEDTDFEPKQFVDQSTGNPELESNQERILSELQRIIHENLTERQRQAIMAEYFHGLSKEALLDKLDTNRNAAYKLLHDARKKLKQGLEEAGIGADQIAKYFKI